MEGDIIVMVDNAPSVMMMPVTLFRRYGRSERLLFPASDGTYLRLVRYVVTLFYDVYDSPFGCSASYPESVPENAPFYSSRQTSQHSVIVQLIIA